MGARTLNLLLIAGLTLLLPGPRVLFPLWAGSSICFIFIRKNVKRALALLSFAMLFLIPRYQVSYRPFITEDTLAKFRPLAGPFGEYNYEASIALQASASLAFLLGLIFFWRRLQNPLSVVALVFPTTLAMFLLYPSVAGVHPWLGFFLSAMGLMLMRSLLPALFFRQVNFLPKLRFADSIWFSPFWQYDIQNWDGRVPAPEEPGLAAQLLIRRRILVLGAALLGIRALTWVLFSKNALGLENLADTGFYEIATHDQPRWLGWLNIFYDSLYFIVTSLWVTTNLVAAFLNTVGVPVMEGFDRPWMAISFADALSRMFVYYSRMVTLLFYFPLYGRLRAFRRFRPYDQLLALFLSVFLFSMIYHCGRDSWLYLGSGSSGIWLCAQRYFRYSLLLAVMICVSAALERAPGWRDGFRFLKIPLYFFVYSCLVFFALGELQTSDLQLSVFATLWGLR